ncbi:MAG: hypothetical protein LBS65_05070 [Desulfovibrio sp.]|nr:hypothetical protein [Desulfovibrio sp.]
MPAPVMDLKNTAALRNWIQEQYQGHIVKIEDDGKLVLPGRDGIEASVKKRGEEQRQAYAGLDTVIEKAVHDLFVETDDRHSRIKGQEIYYGPMRLDDDYYSIRIKFDNTGGSKTALQGSQGFKIKIAPSLNLRPDQHPQGHGGYPLEKGAIRGISLSVLKREVNPSRIENGVLFQYAEEGSAMSPEVRVNLARVQELAATGTDNEAIRQQTGWFIGMGGR